MIVFGLYVATLGLVFMVNPNPVITLFGFEPVTDVWIRITGLILTIQGFYFFMAVKEEATGFYRWTIFGRLPILFVFLGFVWVNLGPPVLLLFGAFDMGCAIWTGIALRKENKSGIKPITNQKS